MSNTAEQPIQYTPDPSKLGVLAGGDVYFGVTNGNPASVPADRIQVYLARQGLADLAIAQPVDIGPGGVWYYNGSPAQIKVLAPYCVQIMNSLGVQKYYAPAAGDEIAKFIEIDAELSLTVKTVAAYADISAAIATMTVGQQFILLGHTTAGIGGGLFDVVSPSGVTANNGTAVINGAVAAVRSEKSRISINHFGALETSADNTVQINYAIAYVNANPGTVLTGDPGTYITAKLNTITAAHTLDMPGVIFKNKADSITAANSELLAISGTSTNSTFTIDGNQAGYSAGNSSQMLTLSGSGHSLKSVLIHNSPGRGAILNCSNSTFEDCHFDDNANLGFEMSAVSGNRFIGGSTSRNGYGFQKTRANPADQTHDFAAFGHALRFRCYDIIFSDFKADDNGRDGANVNQGSYKIKYIGCTAHRNDDGGFTIAADSTAPGVPGDGESCYEIEYTSCDADNNYTSGLAAYQPVHELTVVGGSYRNNHRVAGKLTTASSYRNGIYVAGGSTGVNIDAKTYDERQTRVITANAAGVLSATGWVAGTKDYYPRAAIISGATRAFIGYVNISAESSGSVTVIAAAFNSAVVGTIAPGDYITQCVQHNGVFIDNNSQGYVKADAWGEKAGPADSGYKIFSGFYSGGQNVLVDGTTSSSELLANPTFDIDILNWTYALPGGGSSVQVVTGVKSAGGLRLIAGAGAARADATLIASGLDHTIGSFLELGVWCRADSQGDATLYLFWAPGAGPYATTVTHPGGGWKYLKIGAYIPVGTTSVVVRLEAAIGKTTYWDNATLRAVELKTDNRDFAPTSRSLPY